MSVSQRINIAYSLNQPLSAIFPSPIVSLRSPATTDKAQIGTVWVNKTLNDAWVLTSIVANSANWLSIGGGAGVFSSLTVTGNANIGTAAGAIVDIGNGTGATAVNIEAGSGNVNIATVAGSIHLSSDSTLNLDATTSINLNTTPVINIGTGLTSSVTTIGNVVALSAVNMLVGTGNFTLNGVAGSTYTIGAATTTGTIAIGGTAQTGAITLGNSTGAQTVNLGVGGTGVKTVNIATGAAANVTTIGTTTAASTVTLNTPTGTQVIAANGLVATVGNITATNGNVVLSTAATYVQLPGPIKIMSGAGAPGAGLAAEAGDLYIRTDPGSATERIYVATGAGAWTNVTCAG